MYSRVVASSEPLEELGPAIAFEVFKMKTFIQKLMPCFAGREGRLGKITSGCTCRQEISQQDVTKISIILQEGKKEGRWPETFYQ